MEAGLRGWTPFQILELSHVQDSTSRKLHVTLVFYFYSYLFNDTIQDDKL